MNQIIQMELKIRPYFALIDHVKLMGGWAEFQIQFSRSAFNQTSYSFGGVSLERLDVRYQKRY